MKTLKFTKQQLEILFSCYLIGHTQTSANDDGDINNGFVKEKDIKRKERIMRNVSKKLVKAIKGRSL